MRIEVPASAGGRCWWPCCAGCAASDQLDIRARHPRARPWSRAWARRPRVSPAGSGERLAIFAAALGLRRPEWSTWTRRGRVVSVAPGAERGNTSTAPSRPGKWTRDDVVRELRPARRVDAVHSPSNGAGLDLALAQIANSRHVLLGLPRPQRRRVERYHPGMDLPSTRSTGDESRWCESSSRARPIRPRRRWSACTPRVSTIALVLTQPDRPAGRGMKLQASPVKQFALEHGIAGRAAAQPAAGRQIPGRRCGGARGASTPRGRRDGRRRLRPDPAAMGAGRAAAGLPEHPCLAAAALARRGADPPRDRGRRRARPASPSCRWTPASTPATCCWPSALADRADDTTARLHDRLAALGGRLIVEALELAACGGAARRSRSRPKA